MTRLERIARDLAAVLSPGGEADWRRFLGMAEEVGTRLFHQLAEMTSPGAAADGSAPERLSGSATTPPRARLKRLQRRPVRRYGVPHSGSEAAALRREYQ